MEITKVYSPDCDICTKLGRIAEPQAIDRGWTYAEILLGDVAINPSTKRDYIVKNHLDDEGMVDLPIYLFSDDQGQILSSGVVIDEEQMGGLMFTFDMVDTSRG